MKKIFAAFIFVFTAVLNVYALDIIPKASIDLPSTFKTDYEVKVSMGFAAEAVYQINDNFSLGCGFEYLIPRTTSPKMPAHGIEAYYANKNFSFLPVYLTIIYYPFENFGGYKPYIRIDGGQNLMFTIDDAVNASAGYYVSGGVGFELLEKFILELAMSRYEAKDNDNSISYKKISFKFGYKFTI